ncbi:zinc finger, CCHC-type containing protein [Tanacetum coccineum]
MRAIETPLSSPMGTMWCLYDPTPSGSISTWEDLTTSFLAQFFPPGRTTKLQNDILMFQQHQVQIFYDHINPATRRTIDQAAGGKLRDKNAEESWALLEDLALYDNESSSINLGNHREF